LLLQERRQLLRAVKFYIELRHAANAEAPDEVLNPQIFANLVLGYCSACAVD
jgi:hypothetical protein